MSETPKKGVQWNIGDISLSGLASPTVEGSMLSVVSTSSLEYINSQLVAHGFAPSPGLVLDGISNSDLERVVKCLLGMLSQRVEDMSRTEELTTKLRTLTYDHERLRSLHKDATETAANAEREMNLHKSRLAAATRAVQASEAAHKQTTAELQRTRTTLQGVRATHQSEMKKKEKDIERMSEKWSKLADAQAKLMAAPSGMRCANVEVVTGSELIGKSKTFLEIALEEAEKARNQLGDENVVLRRLVLKAVNEIQSIVHRARPPASENSEEPPPFTLTTLFPLHPAGNAGDKLGLVLNDLRSLLTTLSQPSDAAPTATKTVVVSDGEIERLQGIINTLREELERSRQQAATHAADTQAMFDKFALDHRIVTAEIGEMSVELMSAPLRDAEKERLDEIKRQLDHERQKFTDAAIKLGKERAELEAERIKLQDEKRAWQVEMMLAELPPTPQPVPSPRRGAPVRQSPKKSPRKSPAKVRVGKAGAGAGRKTTRVSRRSSLLSPSKVIPAYETEVLPPIPAPAFSPKPLPLPTPLLPTSFVLPPPSPQTSLPSQPSLLAAIPPLDFRPESPPESTTPPSPTPSPQEPNAAPTAPSTPPAARRPFPVAKPFAQRMIHAYSPAKPSPLSRILMLGNSPDSLELNGLRPDDTSGLLQPIVEDDCVRGFEEPPAIPAEPPAPAMSLAAELGVSESPPESPLQEKKLEPNVVVPPPVATTAKGRVFHPDPKRFATKDKGKAKAAPVANATAGRVKTSAGVEKENGVIKAEGKVFVAPPRISPPGTKGDAKKVVKPPPKTAAGVSTSRARLTAKLAPPVKGGPRRVPIDSEEAPPIAKSRRG
ncbi:putative afadin- and alpha -actinin-Binding [Lyophyllum shimeji]|uniref:Afadin- and alpha -actinin-Binding n=1 Tax=Lyophyllum shimeji TaxID=47721 RepID=A0A9P3URR6_LYOSH|nr:putative afadin- and alpha -actinin-Binding [Lyophyllum shimeji]